jgi:hypothetical protein
MHRTDRAGNPQGVLAVGLVLRAAHYCRHRMVNLAPAASSDSPRMPLQAARRHIESTTVVLSGSPTYYGSK